MIAETMSILKKVLEKYTVKGDTSGLTDKIRIISRRQESLLEKYLDGKVSDENYTQMDLRLQEEREQLEEELKNQETERDMAHRMELRLKKIEDNLKSDGIEQATAYTLMDSVKQIVVYEEHLEIGARTAFARTQALKSEGRIGVKGHGPGRQWYLIDGGTGNGN